jgi:hypothetical protein
LFFKYLFRDWGPLLGGLIMMSAIYLMVSQFVYVQQAHNSRTWTPVDAQVVTFNSAIASGAKYDAIDELLTKIFLPELHLYSPQMVALMQELITPGRSILLDQKMRTSKESIRSGQLLQPITTRLTPGIALFKPASVLTFTLLSLVP